MAVIIHAIAVIYMFLQIDFSPPTPVPEFDDLASLNGIPVFLTLILFIILIFVLIPTILLKIKKTKKIGAILSLLLGIAMEIYFGGASFSLIKENPWIVLMILPGIFLIAASIYYFKKESKLQS